MPTLTRSTDQLCRVALIALVANAAVAARPDGELEIQVVESGAGQPLAARVHLRDARQRPVRTRGLGLAAHGDHFYLDGSTLLGLRRGQYTFDLDAGWERRTRSGHFEIDRRSQDTERIEVNRFANLAKEGWHAADLDGDRPLIDLGVVLRAEQVAYAPLTTWRAKDGRWEAIKRRLPSGSKNPAGVAEHAGRFVDGNGGDLLLFGTAEGFDAELLPSPERLTIRELRSTRERGICVVAPDITAWRLPVWLAADVLDAVGVIDRATAASNETKPDSKGRPPTRRLFPGSQGPGRWREAIYFHALNAGLRLPAVAGSGTGDTPNPLGASRVYALCPDGFSVDAWWESTLAGRTVVTNGPLLRPSVYGEPPGYVFRLDADGKFTAAIGLNLSTRQTVEYLDLIQDGKVAVSVGLRDWAAAGGRSPELDFTASGWFAVRAITVTQDRYQFALSSPYFVEGESGPRVSRASCQFFLDWLDDLAKQPGATEGWRGTELEAARLVWRRRLAGANAP